MDGYESLTHKRYDGTYSICPQKEEKPLGENQEVFHELPSPLSDRVGNSILRFEATSGFALAATRRFAQLPNGTFVRKLSASGYPWHLPQATWTNYRIPTAGL